MSELHGVITVVCPNSGHTKKVIPTGDLYSEDTQNAVAVMTLQMDEHDEEHDDEHDEEPDEEHEGKSVLETLLFPHSTVECTVMKDEIGFMFIQGGGHKPELNIRVTKRNGKLCVNIFQGSTDQGSSYDCDVTVE